MSCTWKYLYIRSIWFVICFNLRPISYKKGNLIKCQCDEADCQSDEADCQSDEDQV